MTHNLFSHQQEVYPKISIEMMLNLGDLGGGNQDLNSGLSVVTSTGASIFTTPFGDKTLFFTKKHGLIKVMFTFDPEQSYNSGYMLASVCLDYWTSIRDALAEHLLDKSQLKPEVTKEKAEWEYVSNNLSKDAFVEYLKAEPGRLEKYVSLLKDDANTAWDEEKAFSDAIQSKEFRFRFDIAIDAFPNITKDKSSYGSSSQDIPTGRRGVLSFYIQGMPNEAKDADRHNDKDEQGLEDIDVENDEDPTEMVALSLKRQATDVKMSKSKKNLKAWAKLSERLGLNEPVWQDESVMVVHEKTIEDSTELFDNLEKWFNSVLQIRTERLTKKFEDSSSQNLYN